MAAARRSAGCISNSSAYNIHIYIPRTGCPINLLPAPVGPSEGDGGSGGGCHTDERARTHTYTEQPYGIPREGSLGCASISVMTSRAERARERRSRASFSRASATSFIQGRRPTRRRRRLPSGIHIRLRDVLPEVRVARKFAHLTIPTACRGQDIPTLVRL